MLFLKKIDSLIGPLLARLLPRPAQETSLSHPPSRFLFIRPGGIGDAILLIPMILCLREAYPEARIEVMAEKRNSGVFALCPGIDRVLRYDRPRELLSALSRRYDLVIDSEQWHRLSALVARVIRSQMSIGFGTNERKRLFTHPVGYSHDRYERDSFFALLQPLNVNIPAIIDYPFLSVPDIDQQSADKMLKTLQGEPFIVLFPGASIPERCWGVENFGHLAARFRGAGIPVIVVGGREDSTAGSVILRDTPGLNLAGKTSLAETAGVLNRAQVLVGGDSGVLHIGAGLDVPTVSLFGPGIAEKWAPRGLQHRVINRKLACSPCTKFGTTPPCPIGAKCIQDISVDEVFIAAQNLFGLK